MSALVLVIDAHWNPLWVTTWQKGFVNAYKGSVEVMEYSKDKTIQGVKRSYPVPSVVRVLQSFKRSRMAVKFSRLNVYARDNFKCQYCGVQNMTEDLNFDHVVPKTQGGKTQWENIVTSCIDCNTTKGGRTPAQAGLTLLRQPKKPKMLPTIEAQMNLTDIPPEWANYWNVGLES